MIWKLVQSHCSVFVEVYGHLCRLCAFTVLYFLYNEAAIMYLYTIANAAI